MKKLVSILLTLAMILCLSVTAFAADDTTLTIVDDGTVARDYVGYQLLELTTSLKDPEATHDHDEDCYNYGYIFKRSEEDPNEIESDFFVILQEEVFVNSGDKFWDSISQIKPGAANAITEYQILKYLDFQSGDNDAGYHTMRQVADRLYRAIVAAGIEGTELDAEGATIAQGYWLIADVTTLEQNSYETNSLVMVATKGQDNVVIQTKTALPMMEKMVKDIEDSEDTDISDNAWRKVADHDIGDTIPFKLTGTLPSNAQYYQSYKMVFHDTLSDALTLDASSIQVLMYSSKHRADQDTDLNNFNANVTEFFTIPTEDQIGGEFSIGCENVFAITGVTKDTVFVVYYEAELGDNAVIGGDGNINTAHMDFSNDPYSTGTGTTKDSAVTIFTYQLVINKTDPAGEPLAGAAFALYKKNPDLTYNLVKEFTAGEDTTFTWTGLDDGDYMLKETETPAGYNGMSDIRFTISAVLDNETRTLSSLDGGLMGMGVVDTGVITKDIVNNTGAVLPETGAEGTFFLIAGGAMLAMVAAVFMVTRKKMSIYED